MSANRVINKGGRPKGAIETEKHAAINITQNEFLSGLEFKVVGVDNKIFKMVEDKEGIKTIECRDLRFNEGWQYYCQYDREKKKAWTYLGIFEKKQEVKISFAEK